MSSDRFELLVGHEISPADLLAATTSISQTIASMPASLRADTQANTEVVFWRDYTLDVTDYRNAHPNAGIEVPRPIRGYMHKLGYMAIRDALTDPFASYPDLVAMEQVSDIKPSTAEWLWQAINRAARHPGRPLQGATLLRNQTDQETASTVVGLHTTTSLHELAARLVLKPENFAVDPQDIDKTAAGATLLLLVAREAHRKEERDTSIDINHPELRQLREWKATVYEEFDSIDKLENSVETHVIEVLKDNGYHRLSHLVHALGSIPQLPYGVSKKSRQKIWREVQHVLPNVRTDIIQAMADAIPKELADPRTDGFTTA